MVQQEAQLVVQREVQRGVQPVVQRKERSEERLAVQREAQVETMRVALDMRPARDPSSQAAACASMSRDPD